ncbi:MAG: bile acid:sodium symporter, partial [Methanomicrobiales archaeon]|nr:bile acid:sodium symporter [Methanomicrobiales archaeon]
MENLAPFLLPGDAPPVAQALYWLGYTVLFVFILSSMFGTGLSVTLRELLAPVRNRRLLTLALVSNFVFVPLLAFVLIALIPMNGQLAGGLLLVSICAGAPSTMKVAQVTGGNVARAVSLAIFMNIGTIILMPIFLPFVLPGTQADTLEVTGYLVLLILIPILLGLFLCSYSESLAGRLRPLVIRISDISVVVIFATIGVVFLSRMGHFVTGASGVTAIVVATLFTLGALGLGFLLGSFAGESREEIAFGAAFRNI